MRKVLCCVPSVLSSVGFYSSECVLKQPMHSHATVLEHNFMMHGDEWEHWDVALKDFLKDFFPPSGPASAGM